MYIADTIGVRTLHRGNSETVHERPHRAFGGRPKHT